MNQRFKKMDRPNIILIVIDTLKAHNLSSYGYHRRTSPFLDAHAAGGTHFKRAYAEVIPTQPSFTSILTGSNPIVNNVVSHVLWKNAEMAAREQSDNVLPGEAWRDRMPKITPQVKMVGEMFQAGGYKTYAVDNLVKMRSHFDRGWDEYIYSSEASGEDKRFAVVADDINFHAFPLLSRIKNDPFFLFLHYWDPHAPYEPPSEFQQFVKELKDQQSMRKEMVIKGMDLSKEDFIYIAKVDKDVFSSDSSQQEEQEKMARVLKELEARYDGEIAYVDDRLNKLFKNMNKLGLDKNTIVVITSDHGESFGSHNTLGHAGLHESIVHVPLWFHGPGIPAGKAVDSLVRHVDIVPTILDFAGIKPDIPYELSGRNLGPIIDGKSDDRLDAVYCTECGRQKTRSIRTYTWKFICSIQEKERADHMPVRELYNMEKDPYEERNVIEQYPEKAAELEQRLFKWVENECRRYGRAEDVLRTTPLPDDLKAYDDPSKFVFNLPEK